jgi:hypothetical protein
MSKTSSIWDKVKASKPTEKENVSKELTDEIRHFREKQKEFQATNEKEFFFSVVFSTVEDRKTFMREVGLMDRDFMVDGYLLAKKLGLQPQKPKFKLKPPF